MKEYQGPAFKAKNYKPVKLRRFNRQFEHYEWSKPAKDQLNFQNQAYQLPTRTLDLKTLETLSAPVNEQAMDRHIEIKQNQQVEESPQNRYQVAFKEAPNQWQEDKVTKQKTDLEGLTYQDEVKSTVLRQASSQLKSSYQPAYQPTRQGEHKLERVQLHNQTEALDKLTQANLKLKIHSRQAQTQDQVMDERGKQASVERAPQEQVAFSTQSVNPEVVKEKSIGARQIRDVALRMVKRPESFLLFDESK